MTNGMSQSAALKSTLPQLGLGESDFTRLDAGSGAEESLPALCEKAAELIAAMEKELEKASRSGTKPVVPQGMVTTPLSTNINIPQGGGVAQSPHEPTHTPLVKSNTLDMATASSVPPQQQHQQQYSDQQYGYQQHPSHGYNPTSSGNPLHTMGAMTQALPMGMPMSNPGYGYPQMGYGYPPDMDPRYSMDPKLMQQYMMMQQQQKYQHQQPFEGHQMPQMPHMPHMPQMPPMQMPGYPPYGHGSGMPSHAQYPSMQHQMTPQHQMPPQHQMYPQQPMSQQGGGQPKLSPDWIPANVRINDKEERVMVHLPPFDSQNPPQMEQDHEFFFRWVQGTNTQDGVLQWCLALLRK
jgi:hypothetical protein